ncbi:hypothetical protein FOZ62_020170, partial [Perkinsus olseni]
MTLEDDSVGTAEVESECMLKYGIPEWRLREVVMAFRHQVGKSRKYAPRQTPWKKSDKLLDIAKERLLDAFRHEDISKVRRRPGRSSMAVKSSRRTISGRHGNLNSGPDSQKNGRDEEARGPSGYIEADDIIETLAGWKMRPEEIREALRGHLTAD